MSVPIATQLTAVISYLALDFSPKYFVAIIMLKIMPEPALHAIRVRSQKVTATKRPMVPRTTRNNPKAPFHVKRTALLIDLSDVSVCFFFSSSKCESFYMQKPTWLIRVEKKSKPNAIKVTAISYIF